MTEPSQIVLAIESAISGGSISLLHDGNEIANWIGTSNVSKAEELLANIDDVLTANSIRKQDINMIAVAAGPGSFTGIRIGIATALGLKAGLGIRMSSESALKAMVFSHSDNGRITAAIPMGRNAVCLQSFEKQNGTVDAVEEPRTLPEESFLSLIHDDDSGSFLLHFALYEKAKPRPNVVNFGANIAHCIGAICREHPGVVVEPLFVSKSF